MQIHSRRAYRFTVGLVGLLTIVAGGAFGGPPLICHTFDIGSAKSLPWTGHGWNLSEKEDYDTSKLASDTFAILASDSTVLVHMETLRRATLYARKNPVAAKELLTRLMAATKSVQSDSPPALYYFDIGYLAETYKQWLGQDSQNPARGIDGYALVKQALELRGNDPQMEFAAAMITLAGPPSEHQQHVEKAVAGAKSDPLLARNLSSHFMGNDGQTITEMLTKPIAVQDQKP
jgi:hypothetical protein